PVVVNRSTDHSRAPGRRGGRPDGPDLHAPPRYASDRRVAAAPNRPPARRRRGDVAHHGAAAPLVRPRSRSGGEALAALGPTGLDDRLAGARAHAGAEAVLAVATAVVRLEGALHGGPPPPRPRGRWASAGAGCGRGRGVGLGAGIGQRPRGIGAARDRARCPSP